MPRGGCGPCAGPPRASPAETSAERAAVVADMAAVELAGTAGTAVEKVGMAAAGVASPEGRSPSSRCLGRRTSTRLPGRRRPVHSDGFEGHTTTQTGVRSVQLRTQIPSLTKRLRVHVSSHRDGRDGGVAGRGGDEGSGGEDGGDSGDVFVTGGWSGGDATARGPQSEQSAPRAHDEYSAPGPPSSCAQRRLRGSHAHAKAWTPPARPALPPHIMCR